MSKVKLIYCDICKDRIIGSNGDVRIKYQAKRRWVSWYECSWDKIDICDKCLNKIISAKEGSGEE